MFHVALLTLALASGECPDCQRALPNSGYNTPNRPGATDLPMATAIVPPRPILNYPSITQMIPTPCVGCVGQNCFSTTRPFLPGVPVFDYRREFNYPWSQMPCRVVPTPIAVGYGPQYGPVDGPEEVPAPPFEARRAAKTKGTVGTKRSSVLVSRHVKSAAERTISR